MHYSGSPDNCETPVTSKLAFLELDCRATAYEKLLDMIISTGSSEFDIHAPVLLKQSKGSLATDKNQMYIIRKQTDELSCNRGE